MAASALRNESYIYADALPLPVEAPAPRVNTTADAIAKPRELTRPRVSFFSVLGFVFIASLAVACMLSHIELTRISADITGVRGLAPKIKPKTGIAEKLSERREQNNALRVEYERAFDLKEIERYAIEELGMVRPQTPETRSVGITPADKAVVPATERNKGGAAGLLDSILEYFR
ncbi:MAG: hypothetical protein LBH17_07110 [Oscillospiraceae bacterium]|jgi:hypothetical protein|nr:hypothetical protein [Oscillospiraceae bacterium]